MDAVGLKFVGFDDEWWIKELPDATTQSIINYEEERHVKNS